MNLELGLGPLWFEIRDEQSDKKKEFLMFENSFERGIERIWMEEMWPTAAAAAY